MLPSPTHPRSAHGGRSRSRRAWRLCALFACAFLALATSGCEDAGDSVSDVPLWTYSGIVLDGAADTALDGALVEWVDASGVARSTTTDARGAFYARDLPYGQRTLRLSSRRIVAGDTLRYGERLLSVSSYTESSSMPGALASGSRVVRLFPLNGSAEGVLMVRVAGTGGLVPARGAFLRMVYRDTTFLARDASSFVDSADSAGRFRFDGLPADSGLQIGVPRFQLDGRWYASELVPVPMLAPGRTTSLGRIVLEADTAADFVEPVAASNVLDAQGLGLSGVGVSETPWFRMAFPIDPARLEVQLLQGATPVSVVPETRGDTVFLRHPDLLPAGAALTTSLWGSDREGRRFSVVLDGNRRFRTRPAPVAIESNAWPASRAYLPQVEAGDTLWVRFSEPLATDPTLVSWTKANAARSLYGRGPLVNASSWVRAETLFVAPDQRLRLDTVGKVGFNVVVTATSGGRSAAVEIAAEIASTTYSIQWSNAVNGLGQFRDDLGATETVKILPNRPVAALEGVSAAGAALPPGIQSSDVTMHGDTIVYKPSGTLPPGIVYGLAFDLRDRSGTVFRQALTVRWKTVYRMSVVSADNRSGAEYRRFRSLGDSLVVGFSRPVDTASPFVVRMKDARGMDVQTRVTWNGDLDRATIRNTTPLPLANLGVAATSSSVSDSARAVADISFDLVSVDGERITGLRSPLDSLRIYTEEGLVAVGSNVLKSHSTGYEVRAASAVVDSFPVSGQVRVTFNRALDTSWIRRVGDSTFVDLQVSTGSVVPSDVRFEDGGRTVVLVPRAPLVAGSLYQVQFVRIPGAGIRDAAAIGRHGGTWSGTTPSGFLTATAFQAR